MIRLEPCSDNQAIDKGIDSLVKVFESKHTYYKTWCLEKKRDLFTGKRELYKIVNKRGIVVGYVMINYVTDKYAKLNAIYIDKKFQKRGYARDTFLAVIEKLTVKGYDYLFIQTRHYNSTVLHMFESMNFDVIGEKFHEIEHMNNVVACYSLGECKRGRSEVCSIATRIYEGFIPNTNY